VRARAAAGAVRSDHAAQRGIHRGQVGVDGAAPRTAAEMPADQASVPPRPGAASVITEFLGGRAAFRTRESVEVGPQVRAYFELPPHFRYLAMADGELAGQVGVELRVIRIGSTVLRTFGVVDLCVRESGRSHGLAGRMLAELTELARSCRMDFIILFADDDRLYARNGWARAANPCSWLKIDDHTTLGLATAEDTGALMVKKTGQRDWPEGEVDLLGHLF
jgi:GNAT superfamily N-acetyltransferase